MYTKAVLPKKS